VQNLDRLFYVENRLSNNTTDFTHGLHRFAAKFIPQIPRWAIDQFAAPGACVLDPFMGSGTTLVEGLLTGVRAIGIDIDPLARLIAHAKTDVPSSARVVELGAQIRTQWKSHAGPLIPPMPDIENFGHWYSNDAWGKLQSLFACIQNLECSNTERTFLLAVFSSILRWVSNADDQSQKTYVSGTNRKTPPEVGETFWHSYDRALRGLKDLERARSPYGTVMIPVNQDARDLGLPSHSVDLIVTSPPYLDSVDYMYNFMLEYFWLGPILGVPNRHTFNKLRRHYIGAKIPEQKSETMSPALADLLDLSQISKTRARAVTDYYLGMSQHFAEAARCLREDGRYVLAIGNSQTRTTILPVHDGLLRLAASSGLELEKAFAYRVRRHYMKFPRAGRGGIILIDWIIVLRKVGHSVGQPKRLPLPWVTLDHTEVAY